MAASSWYHLAQMTTRVRVIADRDGVAVECGTQDMGNGTRTVLARAVAGVMGINPHEITVRIGDSDGPHGPLCGGSRTTTSVYATAVLAAEQVLEDVQEHLGSSDAVDWKRVIPTLPRIEANAKRPRDTTGWLLPISIAEISIGRSLGHTVMLAEVEVDTWLGRVRPLAFSARFAIGKVVAPKLAESQAFGAMVQMSSHTLYEARQHDAETGRLVSANLEDYRIAGIGDIGEMNASFDEAGREGVAGQVMGMSELAACPVPAALGNAVFNATGWRPTELPIRADHVLKGLA